MTNTTYKVARPVAGRAVGAKVTDEDLVALNVPALVEGGFLEVDQSEPLVCAACAAVGKERKAKTLETLQKHYEKDHQGLAPPTGEE